MGALSSIWGIRPLHPLQPRRYGGLWVFDPLQRAKQDLAGCVTTKKWGNGVVEGWSDGVMGRMEVMLKDDGVMGLLIG